MDELKKTNLELENQMKSNNELMQVFTESSFNNVETWRSKFKASFAFKLWISEKSKAEENYMSLVEKYTQRNIEFELLKESSLKAKNETVDQMNLVNELEKELSEPPSLFRRFVL